MVKKRSQRDGTEMGRGQPAGQSIRLALTKVEDNRITTSPLVYLMDASTRPFVKPFPSTARDEAWLLAPFYLVHHLEYCRFTAGIPRMRVCTS